MLQLYDLAGIYYRAYYALPSTIVGPHGRPVGAVRGSLDMLARVIGDARPTRAVACLDLDWRPAWRVELVSSYKAHRVEPAPEASPGDGDSDAGTAPEEVPDELAEQVPVLLDILRAVGISTAGAVDCEADDVIGTLCHRETTDAVDVVTGDRDLYQVVRSAPTPVAVRYIGAGMAKMHVVDDEVLRTRYGVDGAGYAAMATLRGDPSDGLPGVAGIGEKTAAALVRAHGSIAGIVAAAADPRASLTPRTRERISGARDYLHAAARVVAVRTDADIVIDGPHGSDELRPGPADGDAVRSLAVTHGVERSVSRLLDAIGR